MDEPLFVEAVKGWGLDGTIGTSSLTFVSNVWLTSLVLSAIRDFVKVFGFGDVTGVLLVLAPGNLLAETPLGASLDNCTLVTGGDWVDTLENVVDSFSGVGALGRLGLGEDPVGDKTDPAPKISCNSWLGSIGNWLTELSPNGKTSLGDWNSGFGSKEAGKGKLGGDPPCESGKSWAIRSADICCTCSSSGTRAGLGESCGGNADSPAKCCRAAMSVGWISDNGWTFCGVDWTKTASAYGLCPYSLPMACGRFSSWLWWGWPFSGLFGFSLCPSSFPALRFCSNFSFDFCFKETLTGFPSEILFRIACSNWAPKRSSLSESGAPPCFQGLLSPDCPNFWPWYFPRGWTLCGWCSSLELELHDSEGSSECFGNSIGGSAGRIMVFWEMCGGTKLWWGTGLGNTTGCGPTGVSPFSNVAMMISLEGSRTT